MKTSSYLLLAGMMSAAHGADGAEAPETDAEIIKNLDFFEAYDLMNDEEFNQLSDEGAAAGSEKNGQDR